MRRSFWRRTRRPIERPRRSWRSRSGGTKHPVLRQHNRLKSAIAWNRRKSPSCELRKKASSRMRMMQIVRLRRSWRMPRILASRRIPRRSTGESQRMRDAVFLPAVLLAVSTHFRSEERIQTNCRAFAGRRSVSRRRFCAGWAGPARIVPPGRTRRLGGGRGTGERSERAGVARPCRRVQRGGDVLIVYVDVKQDALLANDFDRKLSLSRIGLDPSPARWVYAPVAVPSSANGARRPVRSWMPASWAFVSTRSLDRRSRQS